MRSLILKIALGFLVALAIALFAFAEPAADLPIIAELPTATMVAPTESARAENTPTPRGEPTLAPRATPTKAIPVYASLDFLTDYLTNRTRPNILEGKPWINSSINVAQLQEQFNGTTFWDFWGEEEKWETTNHMWQDDDGKWSLYKQETLKFQGRDVPAYVLVDRKGPGVMDTLWFTHETIIFRGDVRNHLNILGKAGLEDMVDWGNLHKLGNLRVEIDDRVAYDGAIREWFSGNAQRLSPDLARMFVWRYGQYGAFGNIIPLPYQTRLKVSVYGGMDKPKWFMATGITLPRETRVKPYSVNDLPREEMAQLAQNVLQPENFITQFPNLQTREHTTPARIELNGAGTLHALQFTIPKQSDPKQLALRVRYGDEIGIDLPFIAFFTDHDYIVAHRSTPIGVIESRDAYIFYCNFPMPYQTGMTIELTSKSATPITLTARFAASNETANTQLRADYKSNQRLQPFTPDYQVKLPGNGKLVGIVFVTKDQDFKKVPTRNLPGTNQEDPATHSWPNGYLESNLSLVDGAGNARLYGGDEDWAGGGYYFNLGYTVPSGGGNRPFAGILRYREAEDGYATIYRYFSDLAAFRFKRGLTLSFGHGTWRNNYPVTYGTTVLYYRERE
ncbi:MAG: DUF2961 domain-containing protein [Chloroflexi bacterium]|nr:DUF2961 domain-containing protein [Chloroflexota bacterium]